LAKLPIYSVGEILGKTSVRREYRNVNAHGIGKVSSKNVACVSSINVDALNGTESDDTRSAALYSLITATNSYMRGEC